MRSWFNGSIVATALAAAAVSAVISLSVTRSAGQAARPARTANGQPGASEVTYQVSITPERETIWKIQWLDAAKKAMAAAEAEATKNNWPVAIAILDSTGHLVALHKMDNVQYASIKIAEGKAQTAIDFRRPSKALEDVVAGGGAGLRVLTFGNILVQGGVPIVAEGKIIGSIGVSGVTSQQDEQIAMAGAGAAK